MLSFPLLQFIEKSVQSYRLAAVIRIQKELRVLVCLLGFLGVAIEFIPAE